MKDRVVVPCCASLYLQYGTQNICAKLYRQLETFWKHESELFYISVYTSAGQFEVILCIDNSESTASRK